MAIPPYVKRGSFSAQRKGAAAAGGVHGERGEAQPCEASTGLPSRLFANNRNKGSDVLSPLCNTGDKTSKLTTFSQSDPKSSQLRPVEVGIGWLKIRLGRAGFELWE